MKTNYADRSTFTALNRVFIRQAYENHMRMRERYNDNVLLEDLVRYLNSVLHKNKSQRSYHRVWSQSSFFISRRKRKNGTT